MSKFAGRVPFLAAAIASIGICAPKWQATVHADCTAQWVAGFDNPEGALNGPALATAVFDDGNGPALYAAGAFVSTSGITVYSVTKWNGSSWFPLGTGPQGTVRALAVFDDGSGPALYAGGDFTQEASEPANHISKWNGSDWSTVGAGLSGTVWAFTVFDDGSGSALYAGGAFTMAGGVPANRVAKWDGTNWSALGAGTGGIVRTLEVFNDGNGAALYAGGDFVTAGGMTVERMARWNGTAWSAMSGMNDTVWALRASGGSLYAGGSFTSAGGAAANRIARWNGVTWSTVGTGMNEAVYALTDFDDGSGSGLNAAGAFTQAGGGGANRIARWNGSTWSGVAGGADAEVRTLASFNDGVGNRLFAGGHFRKLDGHAVASVGAWNGSQWSPLNGGDGTDGLVKRLVSFDDGAGPALYAAGLFTTAGGSRTNGIAKWNGSTWSSLPASASGGLEIVNATGPLEVVDDGNGPSLVAGVLLSGVGPPWHGSQFGVAKWDGNTLATFATGLDQQVDALAEFDDGTGSALYAGGAFSMVGGVAVNGIAKLNGNSWSNLGTGLSNGSFDGVRALTVFNDGNGPALYVGGHFSRAGGLAVQNIAKWDGAAWSNLGTGVNGWIYSLVVFDDGTGPALYAGGGFGKLGDDYVEAYGIARWNGASWSAVGDGFRSGGVNSMVVFDDGNGPALYVAGYAIGGNPYTHRLGKWDGATWSVVETGFDRFVQTLGVFNGGSTPLLFAGGDFIAAGNSPAFHIAAMSGCALIVEPPPPTPAPPVVVPGSDVINVPIAAPPDPVASVDNSTPTETETPQLADEHHAPIANGASPCGMGMEMAASGLMTGMWMMRRTGSRCAVARRSRLHKRLPDIRHRS